ncbi:(E)-4-hydroxy-3-methylbut-2-enyl-diphosphate synthase (flavodoxin) [Candidatus Syntrophocurvum alkaliphilum]|uniref:4-hydroxy-3-methylbut-2-en-1-yl diphosphate synthase (flavodoxin) n=1 Tax=Candidatus Syntrophocurvum alkaliphilum TaxID=2293317 RepID=A0A6I6DD96_9FIRM|nr:flavodoxin-dependent (E)-4-hydroxy-3-methylbut-2-enyl-diphosphate synthase [Candidatus Syntrophocurvum alkaliphilum]QGT99205.1 (E)-4-hydroxy-3-methylbut-2-enyl-diphosphate synthase (flavodoxin) [Candidatus Syntrophocurvum alkaliphilum]
MAKHSKIIKIGDKLVGGNNPIVVQSMTNTDTRDVSSTVEQIKQLEKAGCELVRVAVVDNEAAISISKIKKQIKIPLIADIHFNYKLALKSIDSGVDALRINPGNIGSNEKIKTVVKACQERKIPIRIGVNAGSLDKRLLEKYNGVTKEAMVESAMQNIKILEDMNFNDIKVSLKASSVKLTIDAYQEIAKMIDYPLHIGVTEAGTTERALIKSSFGLGMLLYKGIGDTLRVSLTDNPVNEVWAAYEILRMLNLRNKGIELISCPGCGRCEIDLVKTAEQVDKKIRDINKTLKVAVMGCVVNGPGEAREADLGIAGGRGFGLLFKNGEIIRKVNNENLVDELLQEIKLYNY